VNPGQSTTFPWGSKVAQLYEEYEFEQLEFYYKREVSEFATNGQAGKVILSFDYDAADPTPTTKQQVEDSDPHVDGMPCTPLLRLPIDRVMMRKGDAKFVRPGAQPANTDIKTYDVGNLIVSTQGCTNTTTIGELHVRYRVRFSKPVLEAASTVGGVVHFQGVTPTTANNFATAVLKSGGTPSLTGITLGTNSIIFPSGIPGNYLVCTSVVGSTSATLISWTGGLGTGIALNLFDNATTDDSSQVRSANGGVSVPAMASVALTVPTAGCTITLQNVSTIVGGTGVDVFIISLPASVLTISRVGNTYSTSEIDTLVQRLSRMEAVFSCASNSNNHNSAKKLQVSESDSDCESFLEQKEADMVKSVHISQSLAQKLSKAFGQ